MSSSGLAAVILNFRLPVASETSAPPLLKSLMSKMGEGKFFNFVPSWYGTGDSPGE